jgi:hypothetical protein
MLALAPGSRRGAGARGRGGVGGRPHGVLIRPPAIARVGELAEVGFVVADLCRIVPRS